MERQSVAPPRLARPPTRPSAISHLGQAARLICPVRVWADLFRPHHKKKLLMKKDLQKVELILSRFGSRQI